MFVPVCTCSCLCGACWQTHLFWFFPKQTRTFYRGQMFLKRHRVSWQCNDNTVESKATATRTHKQYQRLPFVQALLLVLVLPLVVVLLEEARPRLLSLLSRQPKRNTKPGNAAILQAQRPVKCNYNRFERTWLHLHDKSSTGSCKQRSHCENVN